MKSMLSKATLAAVFAMTASLGVTEARAQAAPPMAMPTAAPAYLQMASSGDMFEIQSSQHALQVTQDPHLRSMAQMIIDDHTRLSAELKAAAAAARVPPPPPALAPHHAQMLDQLRSTSSANFDAVYRQQQITAHQEALSLHRTYAASGDMPALRQAASRAVPVIEKHLQHVQQHSPMAPGTMPSPGMEPSAEQRAGERG